VNLATNGPDAEIAHHTIRKPVDSSGTKRGGVFMRKACCLAAVAVVGSGVCVAQSFDAVKIIAQRNSETGYSYAVPGSVNSTTNTTAACSNYPAGASCSGASTTTGIVTPARTGVFQATGATLTLQLPDGRIAVVNCNSKYQVISGPAHRRSCRVPATDTIQAEFHADKAKLKWTVSLDGKKLESETYKVLAVYPAAPPAHTP
jgi:hypothetical protein